MKRLLPIYCAIATGLLVSPAAWSQGYYSQADWVHLVRGYQQDEVAPPLRPIEARYDAEKQRVYVTVPPIEVADPNTMEEVMVIAPAPEQRGPLINLDYELEWASDYDNDRYGLLVYFTEDSNWPLRLFMDSNSGYIR